MAVSVNQSHRALKIQVQTGTNSTGGAVYSTRTLGDVRPESTNDDLYAIASATGSLIAYPINEISVSSTDVLVNG